ncbi:type 2 periplasmic-binding domain-containing protein [Gilvimarinus agarilyticus]|uniref:hypothetical protein n=1 Tax=Gilvimarinus agarilyticus TaxID=679259 RepID=UPI0012F7E0F5|nr:hypothetical protein [Gilvimarinus agarilyticus]
MYGLADTGSPTSGNTDSEFTLWIGNMTEARKSHESAVVRLALDKSRDHYGPYKLTLNTAPFSRPRAIRNLRDGEIAQIVTAPELTYRMASDEQPLITIPIPLLKGLLGSRVAIVRRERAAQFAEVHSVKQLQQFNAGLGFDWLDRDFFRDAGLPFTSGADIDQLFNMLVHGRFDYLPLGSIEAAPTLAASGHAAQLTIVDDLLIHYPLPVYVQVSHNRPELAARLRFGLERARRDGSLNALFEQHYGAFRRTAKNAYTIELHKHEHPAFSERRTSP